MKGIDLSPWNKSIDWNKVKSDGISFAIIKASEGLNYHYSSAISQAEGAKSVGIQIGYYHFSSLGFNSGKNEAIFFNENLKSLPKADIIPTLDVETNKKPLSKQDFTDWVVEFVNTMKSLGHPNVMIYTYKPFINEYLLPNKDLTNCPLWLAQYTTATHPSLPSNWTKAQIWQYSDKGQVNGIQGFVDVNSAESLPLI